MTLFMNFALAILPIIWLIIALCFLKMPAHLACLITAAIAFVEGIFFWQLDPLCASTAVLEGTLNALWPIALVIIAALFTYNLTVATGAMDTIKKILTSVSSDKRVLALLIAWGFGNFMEGMAGFGTPVAIPASILAGIGMNPILAVVGCLVVNATPTPFGSVGVPAVTLATVTGIDIVELSTSLVQIELIACLVAPFFLVCIVGGGLKGLKGMIPTCLIASLSFVLPWFFLGSTLGAELPDIVGSLISMVCIVAAAKIFNKNVPPEQVLEGAESITLGISLADGIKAWSPFILVAVLLLGTSTLVAPIHDLIAPIKSSISVYAGENPGTLSFSWINTPGVMIFLAAFIGGFIQKASLGKIIGVLGDTFKMYWKTILVIVCVLATAKLMGYSGMISDIAAFLVVATGPAYPFIAPLIGALGAFVTGSATSTAVLFGGLQAQTAIGLGLNPSWIAAANLYGAGVGKMVAAQNLAIGASAIGKVGQEGEILKAVLAYFLFFLVLAGCITMAGSMMGL